jgi:hypothetical protein
LLYIVKINQLGKFEIGVYKNIPQAIREIDNLKLPRWNEIAVVKVSSDRTFEDVFSNSFREKYKKLNNLIETSLSTAIRNIRDEKKIQRILQDIIRRIKKFNEKNNVSINLYVGDLVVNSDTSLSKDVATLFIKAISKLNYFSSETGFSGFNHGILIRGRASLDIHTHTLFKPLSLVDISQWFNISFEREKAGLNPTVYGGVTIPTPDGIKLFVFKVNNRDFELRKKLEEIYQLALGSPHYNWYAELEKLALKERGAIPVIGD